ncbi:MAG: cation transporter [Omnitrophica bacterium RIFCSPHIGHO2_02_FULL_51_18]|nr:MAG: cation transporter [Omnitrophica bacterium RIFCSPHIGHO2_02_FULL_51_18]
MKHHGHSHAGIDPSIVSHERGLWAVKWSFVILGLTALFQVFVVIASHSVALLADTIHNIGDAATAIPLGIAFMFARLKPSKRFTYGYGRVEDLAGVAVVLTILFSAIVAGYQAINRFIHPMQVGHLWAVMVASVMGFLGNEAVAIFRIKVGKQINSAALIADGYHARTDGWTSLAVLFGALGVHFGYPLADPIIGLVITVAILFIVWDSAKEVFTRMLDGVDPHILDEIEHAIHHVDGVKKVSSIRARWIGHKLHVQAGIEVGPDLSLGKAHEIAEKAEEQLEHHLPNLGNAVVNVDPEGHSH